VSQFFAKVWTGVLPTTTGNHDLTVSGLTETPKGAVIVVPRSKENAVDAWWGDWVAHLGFTDGTNHKTAGWTCDDGDSTSDSKMRGGSQTEIVRIENAASTSSTFEADFVSFISGGIRIDVTDTELARPFFIIFFGGTDCECSVFDDAPNQSTGASTSVTVSGSFAPDFVICSNMPSTDDAFVDHLEMFLGIATRNGAKNVCSAGFSRDGVATSQSYAFSGADQLAHATDWDDTDPGRVSETFIDNWGSTGFDISSRNFNASNPPPRS